MAISLPKTLLVRKEYVGTENEFLLVGKAEDIAVSDSEVEAGLYTLSKYVTVSNTTVTKVKDQ